MNSATIVRIIEASPDAAFAAFIEPDQLALWWGPDDGPVLSVEIDPRVGGKFHIRFRLAEDGTEHGSSRAPNSPSSIHDCQMLSSAISTSTVGQALSKSSRRASRSLEGSDLVAPHGHLDRTATQGRSSEDAHLRRTRPDRLRDPASLADARGLAA